MGEPKVECDFLFTNRPACVAGQTRQASRMPACVGLEQWKASICLDDSARTWEAICANPGNGSK